VPRAFAAPGKLMIAGEYSVLGPRGVALAVAVEPGVEAIAAPSPLWGIERADGVGLWREGEPPPRALSFARAALDASLAALAARGRPAPSPHLLRTRSPAATGVRKPGLGGSASTVAAIASSVVGLAGLDPRHHLGLVLEAALDAHRSAQDGHGSGYDVATVVHGGLVAWAPGERRATSLSWPEGLHLAAAYSGSSARTPLCLVRLRSRAASPEQGLIDLGRPVPPTIAAFAEARLDAALDGVRECHRALARWDEAMGLDVVTPALARLIAIAERLGAAAKVSGAGGGDSAIALSADPDRLEAVSRAWRESGFEPLPIALPAEGAREL
jgi:phosphomevalonate kinase